jgi:hypothetical protein
MYIVVYNLYVYSRQNKIVYNTSKFCGAPFLWRTDASVHHKKTIFCGAWALAPQKSNFCGDNSVVHRPCATMCN